MKLSLIIPAYNEEKRISRVIDSFSAFFDGKYNYELIIVCDGNDNTAGIVKGMRANNPRIKLLEFAKRQGKGGALIHGFIESRGEIVGFVDSDGSVSPVDFEKLIHALNITDCAIASRRAEGARVSASQPWGRRISSKVFNILVNLLFNLGIKDTQCGAKVFKKDLLNFKIKEVPVEWKHEAGSTFSLKYSGTMFLNLLKVRFFS